MGSLLDTVGGLPVHALVVHAVVIIVPMAALGAIAMAIRPAFSRRFGPLVVVVAGAGVVASVVAKESGEQLTRRLGTPQPHADLGSVMPYVSMGLFGLLLVFWLFDRGVPMNKFRPFWLVVLAIVLVLGSIAATWWTFRVGHSGAEAAWLKIIKDNPRRAG